MVHLPRFRLISWVNVGKYTSPMDPMGGVDATNDAVDRVGGRQDFSEGFLALNWSQILSVLFLKHKHQGIVGCTPTNVPLWEIPI